MTTTLMDVATKRQQKTKLVELMQGMLNRASAEGRDLSRSEQRKFEELEQKSTKLADAIVAAERQLGSSDSGRLDPRFAQGGSVARSDVPDVLRKEDRMADWAAERGHSFPGLEGITPDEFSLGRALRGLVLGDWRGAEAEQRVMSVGSGAGGGYLLPTPLAGSVIDRIRNQARVFQAGAVTVPMEAPTLYMARLANGPNPALAWKAENNPVTASDLAIERLTFTAKTLPILIKLSTELFEDLTDAANSAIEHEVAMALALELDRAALRGSGVDPEPLGIKGQSGVTLQSMGANGASPTWDTVVDAISSCRNANVEPNAAIFASRSMQTLSKLKDSQGRYITPPPTINDVKLLPSNQIPINQTVGTSADCSDIYVGDWSSLLVGIRTDLRFEIKVLSERFADNLQTGLLTWLRADIQLAHPAAFTCVSGVRP